MANGTFTEDGSTDWFTDGYPTKVVIAEGTWGSGTLTLQVREGDTGTAVTVGGDSTITEDGTFQFTNKTGVSYRLTLSGSSSPDLNWSIV